MSSNEKGAGAPSKKELRVFNLIWVAVFLVIGAATSIHSGELNTWPLVVSATFLVIAATYPNLSLPFYRVWVKFGGFIGRVNAKIIMGLIFYLVITPIGILARMIGKDLLGKKLNSGSATYWDDRDIQPGSMKNQF
jgi:hypothetical protein